MTVSLRVLAVSVASSNSRALAACSWPANCILTAPAPASASLTHTRFAAVSASRTAAAGSTTASRTTRSPHSASVERYCAQSVANCSALIVSLAPTMVNARAAPFSSAAPLTCTATSAGAASAVATSSTGANSMPSPPRSPSSSSSTSARRRWPDALPIVIGPTWQARPVATATATTSRAMAMRPTAPSSTPTTSVWVSQPRSSEGVARTPPLPSFSRLPTPECKWSMVASSDTDDDDADPDDDAAASPSVLSDALPSSLAEAASEPVESLASLCEAPSLELPSPGSWNAHADVATPIWLAALSNTKSWPCMALAPITVSRSSFS
mmetsp:Transcript_21775/g.76444  ORF Transcript_21775/g.76444 Transcript_21775/m.76444 type:complete len:325 (-) Transcript_21775:1229-2203(-)